MSKKELCIQNYETENIIVIEKGKNVKEKKYQI